MFNFLDTGKVDKKAVRNAEPFGKALASTTCNRIREIRSFVGVLHLVQCIAPRVVVWRIFWPIQTSYTLWMRRVIESSHAGIVVRIGCSEMGEFKFKAPDG